MTSGNLAEKANPWLILRNSYHTTTTFLHVEPVRIRIMRTYPACELCNNSGCCEFHDDATLLYPWPGSATPLTAAIHFYYFKAMSATAASSAAARWSTALRRAAGVTTATAFIGAWYYRPIADRSTDGTGPKRSEEFFCSESNPYVRERTPVLLETARALSIGITTLAIRIFMNTYGTFEVKDDANYQHFVSTVLGEGRQNGEGLVTISNHRSLFDDPGVMSGILPWWITFRPKYNRWGICSQEYCFNDILPGIVKGYIGAGQVLPICRGKGINQKLLLDFARHLAAGEWCHLFPEGGVWQLNQLGGRRDLPLSYGRGRVSGEGKLRWGVGKLIAHAPVRPRVIPFAHAGIENLLPQDPESGITMRKKDLIGGEPLEIMVQFGKEIVFDDLIQEHERKHGKLWTYNATKKSQKEEDDMTYGGLGGKSQRGEFHNRWDSSPEERLLYSKITSRIEAHLEALTQHVVAEQDRKRRRWQQKQDG